MNDQNAKTSATFMTKICKKSDFERTIISLNLKTIWAD